MNSFKKQRDDMGIIKARQPNYAQRKRLKMNSDVDELTKIKNRLK